MIELVRPDMGDGKKYTAARGKVALACTSVLASTDVEVFGAFQGLAKSKGNYVLRTSASIAGKWMAALDATGEGGVTIPTHDADEDEEYTSEVLWTVKIDGVRVTGQPRAQAPSAHESAAPDTLHIVCFLNPRTD
jgi:hypothetical protein